MCSLEEFQAALQDGLTKIIAFDNFCSLVRDDIKKGAIKVNCDLTDLDLAINYALGCEMEETGHEISVTAEQIADLIIKHCGEGVYWLVMGGQEHEAADGTKVDP